MDQKRSEHQKNKEKQRCERRKVKGMKKDMDQRGKRLEFGLGALRELECGQT
jgi:hypothetical protein